MHRLSVPLLTRVALVALAACLPDPGADLAGPRVLASTLAAHDVEVPVVPTIELQLSEPLDPETTSPRHVVLIRWEEVGRCDLTPVCAKGQCGAGRCWQDPLSASDLSALDRGEYEADTDAFVVALEAELDAERLRLRPVQTLEPHARYSLVLGAGVRDASGAGLEDEHALATSWRSDFVTGAEDSAGPVPRLVFPPAGASEVPTNLRRIETRFLSPVDVAANARLRLADPETGARVEVGGPVPCEGWVPGFCAAWKVERELPSHVALSIVDGTVVDAWGRSVVEAWPPESFRTGGGPDLDPPDLEAASIEVRGPCVVGDWVASEAGRVVLRVEDATGEQAANAGERVQVAVRASAGSTDVLASLEATDLAANASSFERTVTLGVLPPALAITEVLANPSGPEPHQEFVELYAFGDEPVDLEGMWLADLSWEQVQAELASGDTPGDPLPATVLAPGEIALVVALGFDAGEGSDEAPPASTRLLRVDASLGQGGLKNAGEPLTLYRSDPPALLASYGDFVDTSASAHAGRSVAIVRPTACDVATSWSSHPLGRATPGRLP